jgi:hypothetical protein
METRCESWNIKINGDQAQGIYFSRCRTAWVPTYIEWTKYGICVKYLGVIFDKKVTWRLHIEMIETKVFKIFIRIYFLFKSERLSTNIKLTLQKALIRGVVTFACPAWEFAADNHLLKL